MLAHGLLTEWKKKKMAAAVFDNLGLALFFTRNSLGEEEKGGLERVSERAHAVLLLLLPAKVQTKNKGGISLAAAATFEKFLKLSAFTFKPGSGF